MPSPPADPGLPWLVADIGGTNARLAWVDAAGAAPRDVRTLPVADHASLQDALAAYLAEVRPAMPASPGCAALAVATTVNGDEVAFTNSLWRFSRRALQQALGLARLRVLNDFEALALALPHLQPGQWQAAGGPGQPRTDAALAVIGPGTGLGVAGVLPTPQGWLAVPGEGGHATLAPADDFDSAVLAAARRHFPHVSAERLLSGIGLPVLHQAVAAALGTPAAALGAEQIVACGLDGSDALCGRTLDSFCALLGSFAGSVALLLGARGGVYIGGGIVPRLGERFQQSRFRASFEAKGRFQPYLQDIPTRVVTDTLAALTGAAAALAQDAA